MQWRSGSAITFSKEFATAAMVDRIQAINCKRLTKTRSQLAKETAFANGSTFAAKSELAGASHFNMNKIATVSLIVYAATAAISVTALAQTLQSYSSSSVIQQSSSNQTTEINLDAARLRSPHLLRISASDEAILSGTVAINGEVVEQLDRRETVFDLSPYLTSGRQEVVISGHYSPARSSVQISFSGPGLQVSQQTGGNGLLRQTLIINVH